MTTMCYACNHGQKELGCHADCKSCSSSFCLDLDKRELTLATDPNNLLYSRSSFMDNYAADQHSTITESVPKTRAPKCSGPVYLSPCSLNSASNCVNSISDMTPLARLDGHESIYIHLELPKGVNKHEKMIGSRSSETYNSQTSNFATGLNRNGDATFQGETFRSRTVALESHENGKVKRLPHVNSLEELRAVGMKAGEDPENIENVNSRSSSPVLSLLKTDPVIWMPPDPTNFEDDMDSVANNDDDDDVDCSDGTKWGQSTSLGDSDKVHGNNYKEARQKAMMAAMNGQFKILVSRFLASEGLNSTEGQGSGWLDVVASLSWEAALFIKPDAKEGIAMDPGSYVKVKCVASGARNQSEVIKGLIFKKNAAHKHMPTKFKNPRLLLVKGVLGQRELRLSSFNSMDQEKDYLKSINEMIEACHPNLVLVEKSVSRDMQEFLLAKGMTLVFDMKIARLERIARCIGSQIIPSADILTTRNIKQCDSFHIEKLVEEHNSSTEVGKKTSKTLMFLEGFPKPLGCTILLKGAHIDELKRVKRVIQYTMFAAYQLILETSFFADQRALFSNIDNSKVNDASTNKEMQEIACGTAPHLDSSTDIPTSKGLLEDSAPERSFTSHLNASISSDGPGFVHDIGFCEDNFSQDLARNLTSENAVHSCALSCNENAVNHSCALSCNENAMNHSCASSSPVLPSVLISSFSASLRNLLSDNGLMPITSDTISSFFGFKEDEHYYPSLNDFHIYPFDGSIDGIEANENIAEENPKHDSIDDGNSEALSASNGPVQSSTDVIPTKIETEYKDDGDGVLSPESILVLLSSQCIEKGIVCEQSHLSRIKYYGNFDVSLGRYLQDVLLNPKHACSSCGELPEAHIYCYTHQNGNLTVLVKKLPSNSSLSGETEGKIWMWSRCLKCELENGVSRSTKRIVMSTAAHSLSFGKFLELSFTSHSAASRLSSECGHSLHRDCLRFFGLGSKVAMFRYSPVEIYAACKPPPLLEFTNPNGQDWLIQEAKSLLQRGENFFTEVANFLHQLRMSCSVTLSEQYGDCQDFIKDICEAENMLLQEKADFEAPLFKVITYNERSEKSMNEILGLTWFSQELLLALYIWDRRLHQLSQVNKKFDRSRDEGERFTEKSSIENGDAASGAPNHVHINVLPSISSSSYSDYNHSAEISQSSGSDDMKYSTEPSCIDQSATENAPSTFVGNAISRSSDISSATANEVFTSAVDPVSELHSLECSGLNDVSDLEKMIDNRGNGSGLITDSALKGQHSSTRTFRSSPALNFEDPESLIWIPLSELRIACKKDLNGGYLHKFLFIRTYIPKYLSPMHQLFPQERGLLHYPGVSGNVMSVSEDEISSIIACALALSEEKSCLIETIDLKDISGGKVEAYKETDDPSNLTSEGSVASPYWSSNGSFDSTGMHHSRSFSSVSSDELSSSVWESSQSMDRLITPENLHPEITIGIVKEGLKKYSVVCIHAKQFYALRRLCCPSEQVYISSLSRCKKWDAQGGKSKAFFAKSMDDRFIIKQIKKAELDSFLKFAPDYFKHITHSLSTGSQTCLAKILGIYQVRLTKSGKEVKVDLMVMENLLFGRNVTRTYDLKGALFSRYISNVNDPVKVLLDQNFVEDMRSSPFYVGGRTKHLLQRAIWNDTSFLNAIYVMDYSLLVGVDKKQKHLVFGIIDYLRQYTWDKQLETWVKASLVVPKNSLPTIISPKEYKKRFRKFMSRYFLTVPDSWCSTECSEYCKFCAGGSRSLSSSHFSEPPHREC